MALAALALVVFGAYNSYPGISTLFVTVTKLLVNVICFVLIGRRGECFCSSEDSFFRLFFPVLQLLVFTCFSNCCDSCPGLLLLLCLELEPVASREDRDPGGTGTGAAQEKLHRSIRDGENK